MDLEKPEQTGTVRSGFSTLFKEGEAIDFTVLHGSPDFDAVTFPGSIVDITDLYDSLSYENIQKRFAIESL